MKTSVTCPRCGAENRTGALNCAVCRINLRFAQEHPEEIERMRLEKAPGVPWEGGAAGTSVSKEKPVLLPGLLLLGSFVFAFCLGEAVHELGHFLAHQAYGFNVGIRLDPFGGSRILDASSSSREILGVTSLAGPLFNLLLGTTISLALWRVRRPALLPLLLWGPISMVQEGVTFSLGMLTPGGDADLIVQWAVPAVVLISLGLLLLASGIVAICWLLPLVDLSPADSLGRKFSVVTVGMVSFMFLRLLLSGLRSPGQFTENAVPLVFSLILATIVAMLYGPLQPRLSKVSKIELATVTRPAVLVSTTLGLGMVLFQLISFN
jgi:hypothetical protein